VVVPKVAVVLGKVKSRGKDLKSITLTLRPTVGIQRRRNPKKVAHNSIVRQCFGHVRFTCVETVAVKEEKEDTCTYAIPAPTDTVEICGMYIKIGCRVF
jgi:hypothetical protein